MKLFTAGPVEMFGSTKEIAGSQLPYFRTPEFSEIMLRSEGLVKKLSGAPKGSRAVFLTASGTGAMEASVINLFGTQDRLLVVAGGSFGERFAEICDRHRIEHETIRLEFGEILSGDHLVPYDGKGFTGMLINIHETSTGQLYDIGIVSDFCRKNGMILVVDAISSFLADDMDMMKSSVDAMIFSSQKVLALSPGLSGIVISERACERIEKAIPSSVYFDMRRYLKDMERGQPPFTPAVGTILEMDDMLQRIGRIGVRAQVERMKRTAEHFRERIPELDIELPGYPLSNALTPLLFKHGNALGVYERLRAEHGITLTPSGGPLRDRMLRVGHMGNITEDDQNDLIIRLGKVLE
ncbi:MAG: aminotransferase class V-fold PLP-dependent enzyme [Methanomassiliicoccaceae archaeon]|nr:aminotransferase class V-fold PLP-dependent enzyme [Methanomassiliicoccaceae archaeon]